MLFSCILFVDIEGVIAPVGIPIPDSGRASLLEMLAMQTDARVVILAKAGSHNGHAHFDGDLLGFDNDTEVLHCDEATIFECIKQWIADENLYHLPIAIICATLPLATLKNNCVFNCNPYAGITHAMAASVRYFLSGQIRSGIGCQRYLEPPLISTSFKISALTRERLARLNYSPTDIFALLCELASSLKQRRLLYSRNHWGRSFRGLTTPFNHDSYEDLEGIEFRNTYTLLYDKNDPDYAECIRKETLVAIEAKRFTSGDAGDYEVGGANDNAHWLANSLSCTQSNEALLIHLHLPNATANALREIAGEDDIDVACEYLLLRIAAQREPVDLPPPFRMRNNW